MSADSSSSPGRDDEAAAAAAAAAHVVHGKPFEGMCCLATMEDITMEDGNYGMYTHHQDEKREDRFSFCRFFSASNSFLQMLF
jgi:hypothetical protein